MSTHPRPTIITAPNGASLRTRKACRFVEVCWSELRMPDNNFERRAWITHGANDLYILDRLVDRANIPVDHATFDLELRRWVPVERSGRAS